MTDKYINKKWVDTKMKHDPLYLFENKREKFDKWLKKKIGAKAAKDSDESDEAPPPKQKVQKVVSTPAPATKPIGQPAQPKPVQSQAPMDDLINMKP